uniref:Uncharacterized protein n=1 Tax=Brassica campestris TaxID=3711 RepID=A0A3P5Z651_BRACM|nr:unnamed protein product [Brassica rapa]
MFFLETAPTYSTKMAVPSEPGRCGQQVHISLQQLLVLECCLWHGLLLRLVGSVVQQL